MDLHGGPKLWPSEIRSFFTSLKNTFLKAYGRLVRIKIFGMDFRKNLKRNTIVVANHVTGVDSIILQIALKRRLFMLAAKKWFEGRFIKFFMTFFCDMIPVAINEGLCNFKGIKRAIELLKHKQNLGIFPSAHLDRDGAISGINKGAAFLAIKTNTPIVPVYLKNLILGPEPYSRPWINEAWEGAFSVLGNVLNRRIEVYIGHPIYPRVNCDTKSEIARINYRLHLSFEDLRRQANPN